LNKFNISVYIGSGCLGQLEADILASCQYVGVVLSDEHGILLAPVGEPG
jgi:hypothetical protein